MQESNKFLGEERIGKILFKFAIPCIFSLLISSLYNIVDQIFIGNSEIGYLGNAATNVVFPITIISMAFAWCFGDGAAAYLSLCQGKNDTENAHKAIGNSILMTFIVSLIFTGLGFILMRPILTLFGASTTSLPYAIDYFKIILLFIPFQMLANALTGVIRADGNPIYSMVSTLTGAIINIILDPLFIYKFNMGIKGAAWATIIGQVISFIIVYAYLPRTKTFKLKLESFKLNFKVFSNVVKLGISTFITEMAIVIVSLVCNLSLVKYGKMSIYGEDIPIAVVGICMKVFSIVINIVIGIIIGGQPILGYNYGAKKYHRVKETFKIVAILTLIIGLIATLIIEIWPNLIIGIFGSENALYNEFAILTFRIFLALIMVTCFIKMCSIFFQAVGNPLKATIVSLSRDLLLFVPLVLILPRYYGIKGVLYAAPIADACGLLIALPLLIQFFKNLGPEEKTVSPKTVIKKSVPGPIITIAREHGSQGKYIGELVAQKLKIPYYYKELTLMAAEESGLATEFVGDLDEKTPKIMYDLYLSTAPLAASIQAQDKILKKIAEAGSCVIVGRAADYVLKDNPALIRIFIYAPMPYRIKKVEEMYHDTYEKAKKNIIKSDKARASYYENISNLKWGDISNYDLCIDSSIGSEKVAQIIADYVKSVNKK